METPKDFLPEASPILEIPNSLNSSFRKRELEQTLYKKVKIFETTKLKTLDLNAN